MGVPNVHKLKMNKKNKQLILQYPYFNGNKVLQNSAQSWPRHLVLTPKGKCKKRRILHEIQWRLQVTKTPFTANIYP